MWTSGPHAHTMSVMDTYDPRAIALGREIRAEAAAQRISLRQLAERADLARGSLYLHLNGERAMPLTSLFAIADVLHVSPYELLRRGEERARRDAGSV